MKESMHTTYLKFILSLFLISTISFSCSKSPKSCSKSPESKIQDAIEKVIMSQLDDPASYKLASLQILDTVSYGDNINYDKNLIKEKIENNNSRINQFRKWHSNESEERLNFFLSDEISVVKIYSRALVVLDSVELNMESQINQTAAYICCYKYRANNEMGNLRLNTLYAIVSPSQEFEVRDLQSEMRKLSLTPGDYPNRELVIKEIRKYKSPQDIINAIKNAYK